VAGTSIQTVTNNSFGVEFDDEVLCAVDKLERDCVLKDVNSGNSVTETTPGQRPCHQKEKFSRRKVTATPGSCGRRNVPPSRTVDERVRSNCAEDVMSLTVVKGHGTDKIVSSARDEADDRDVACTWNSPLLVSTPVVFQSKRRVAKGNSTNDNATDADSAGAVELSTTPKRLNSAQKSKTKKLEKTKLFGALLNVSSTSESSCRKNKPRSPEASDRQGSLFDARGNSASAISKLESRSWIFAFLCLLNKLNFILILPVSSL